MAAFNDSMESQYSALVQSVRLLFDDVLSLPKDGEPLDPNFIFAKMESLGQQINGIRNGITMIYGNAIILRRKQRGRTGA